MKPQAAIYSFNIICVLNALLVIVKESYKPLKSAMASMTGHHWVTHGLAVIILFMLLSFILSKRSSSSEVDDKRLGRQMIQGVAVGLLLITGFYVFH